MGRVLVVLVAVAITACSRGTASPELAAVPLPDVAGMEPTVKKQIVDQFDTIVRLTGDGATPAVLAPAYGMYGSLLFAASRADAAEPAYLNAQTLAPGDPRWPYYLGHLYMNRPDRPKAIAAFERTLQLAPDDVAALVWLGKVHLDGGQTAEAEARYSKALAVHPPTVAALYGLGQTALARREYAGAVEKFEQVLAADPRASIAHYPLALAYRALGDTGRAETHLRQQGKTEVGPPDPRMAELRSLLNSAAAEEARGMRAAEGGDFTAAAEHFRKGVAMAPDSVSLRYNLGRALSLTGDLAGAVTAFEETIRRAPKDVDARLALGDLHGRSGRFDDALGRYREALALEPRRADARFGYAGALVGLGRSREALEWLDQSARLFPEDPRFRQALERVRAR